MTEKGREEKRIEEILKGRTTCTQSITEERGGSELVGARNVRIFHQINLVLRYVGKGEYPSPIASDGL